MRKPDQSELQVESTVHVEDFGGASYLELCAKEKRGEVRIYGIAVCNESGAVWRVQYEIVKTPATVTEQKPEPKLVQADLLAVEQKIHNNYCDTD